LAPSEEAVQGEGWDFAAEQKIPEEVAKPEEQGEKEGMDPEAIKRRDASRLIRAAWKIAYELKGTAIEKIEQKKKVKAEAKFYMAYVTIEDRVGIRHLRSQVGKRKELQTTLRNPHDFGKTLIRIFRLKGLCWTLLRREEDGRTAVMPKPMQILEGNAEYIVRIEERLRRRPNAPGSSKRRHFERANQKKGRESFTWSPPQQEGLKNGSKSHEARRSKTGRDEGDPGRFSWTAEPDTRPHVEPPRPAGWKTLVLTPQPVQLSEEGERKLADERMAEWAEDQEEHTERQYQEIQERRATSEPRKEEKRRIEFAGGKRQEEKKVPVPSIQEIETREKKEETTQVYRCLDLLRWLENLCNRSNPGPFERWLKRLDDYPADVRREAASRRQKEVDVKEEKRKEEQRQRVEREKREAEIAKRERDTLMQLKKNLEDLGKEDEEESEKCSERITRLKVKLDKAIEDREELRKLEQDYCEKVKAWKGIGPYPCPENPCDVQRRGWRKEEEITQLQKMITSQEEGGSGAEDRRKRRNKILRRIEVAESELKRLTGGENEP
jgi:hypothetical protein